MKKLLLFFIPALLSLPVSGQNWSPLNTTEAFNFRLDNDAVITSTIRSTSFTASAGDTTFSLSRIMCDTCLTWTGGPLTCDSCYGLINVAQFTGKAMVKNAAGWVNFRNPGSRTIHLHAALNDSWLFDTLNNVTAQVIFTGPATVLGNADSLKTLLLSTGDTVRFSKAHGLVQWPNGYGQNSYYRLEGIHGRNAGVLVPRMKDYFFDFNVGDMFEYHGHKTGGMAPHMSDFIRKYTITGKTVNADTVVYTVQGNWMQTDIDVINWNTTTTYGTITTPLRFVDSLAHTGNLFNNEAVDGDGRIYSNSGSWLWAESYMTANPEYYRTSLFADTNGLQSLRFGLTSDYMAFWIDPGSSIPINPGSDTLQPFQYSGAYALELTEGLGQVFGKFSTNFEYSWGERLMAYRKGNDTVGVFTSDNVLSGISQAAPAENGIDVFPNPASGQFTVVLPAETVSLTLYDLNGREVKQFGKLSGTVQLSVEGLAEGVYVLCAQGAGGVSRQKLIVRR